MAVKLNVTKKVSAPKAQNKPVQVRKGTVSWESIKQNEKNTVSTVNKLINAYNEGQKNKQQSAPPPRPTTQQEETRNRVGLGLDKFISNDEFKEVQPEYGIQLNKTISANRNDPNKPLYDPNDLLTHGNEYVYSDEYLNTIIDNSTKKLGRAQELAATELANAKQKVDKDTSADWKYDPSKVAGLVQSTKSFGTGNSNEDINNAKADLPGLQKALQNAKYTLDNYQWNPDEYHDSIADSYRRQIRREEETIDRIDEQFGPVVASTEPDWTKVAEASRNDKNSPIIAQASAYTRRQDAFKKKNELIKELNAYLADKDLTASYQATVDQAQADVDRTQGIINSGVDQGYINDRAELAPELSRYGYGQDWKAQDKILYDYMNGEGAYDLMKNEIIRTSQNPAADISMFEKWVHEATMSMEYQGPRATQEDRNKLREAQSTYDKLMAGQPVGDWTQKDINDMNLASGEVKRREAENAFMTGGDITPYITTRDTEYNNDNEYWSKEYYNRIKQVNAYTDTVGNTFLTVPGRDGESTRFGEEIVDFLTPEQKDMFTELVDTEQYDAAKAFMDIVLPQAEYSMANYRDEFTENEFDKRGPVWGSMHSFVTNLDAGLEGAANVLGTIFGKDVKAYGADTSSTRETQWLRQQSGYDAGDQFAKWFGEDARSIGENLYGVLMSVGDNVVSMLTGTSLGHAVSAAGGTVQAARALTGPVVQWIMSSSAAANTYYKKAQEGADPDQTIIYAVSDAMIEWLTESYSIEKLFSDPTSIKKYLLDNWVAEGSEELAGKFAGTVFDFIYSNITGKEQEITTDYKARLDAIMAKDPNMDPKKAESQAFWETLGNYGLEGVEEFAAGGLAGLLLSGTSATYIYGSSAKQASQLGTQANTGFDVTTDTEGNQVKNSKYIVDAALSMPTDSQSYKTAKSISESKAYKSGGTVSNYKLGRLIQSLSLDVNRNGKSVVNGSVRSLISTQLGKMNSYLSFEQRSNLAGIVTNAIMNGQDSLSGSDIRTLMHNQDAFDIYKSYMTSNGAEDVQFGKLFKDINSAKKQSNRYRDINGNLTLITNKSLNDIIHASRAAYGTIASAESLKMAENNKTHNATADIIAKASGKNAGNGNVIVSGKNGTITNVVMAGGEIEYEFTGSDGSKQNVSSIDIKTENEAIQTVLSFADINSGLMGDTVYSAILNEISRGNLYTKAEALDMIKDASLIYSSVFTHQAQPDLKSMNIPESMAEAILKRAHADEAAYEQRRLSNAGRIKRVGTGKVYFAEGIDEQKLSKSQQSQVDALRQMGKIIGYNFELFNGNNQQLGSYNQETGAIRIDITQVEADGRNSLLIAAGHELTHFIEHNSPVRYAELRNAVIEELKAKGIDFNKAVQEKMDREAAGTITYGGAVAEVIADACQNILVNSKAIQTLAERNAELTDDMHGFVKKYNQRIKDGLEGIQLRTDESQLLTTLGDYSQQIVDLWDSALMEAVDKTQNGDGVKFAKESEVLPGEAISAFKPTADETIEGERPAVIEMPEEPVQSSVRNYRGEQDIRMTGVKALMNGRDVLEYTMKQNGFSQEEISQRLKFMDEIADKMEEWGVKYRYLNLEQVNNATLTKGRDGAWFMTCVVPNAEYPINIDFSTICDKRADMTELFDTLANTKGKVNGMTALQEIDLSPANIRRINQILKEAGYETACFGCFVEAKRFDMQKFASEFCDMWNNVVDEIAAERGITDVQSFDFARGKNFTNAELDALERSLWNYNKNPKAENIVKTGSIEDRIRNLIGANIRNNDRSYLKYISAQDLITSEGIKQMETGAVELVKIFNAHWGQKRPKNIHAYVPYHSEIATFNKTRNSVIKDGNYNANDPRVKNMSDEELLIDYIKKIGGVRNQSFSDFVPTQLYDALQMLADCEARGFSGQCYTKNAYRAWLMGMSNFKTNLSVMFLIDKNVDPAYAGMASSEQSGTGLRANVNGDGYLVADYAHVSQDPNWRRDMTKQVQSIGYKDATKISTSALHAGSCGAIGVGHSYWHMVAMMNDYYIPYIIGYHRSGMPMEVAETVNLNMSADYTNVQNIKQMPNSFKVVNNWQSFNAPSYATWSMDERVAKKDLSDYTGKKTPASYIQERYKATGSYVQAMKDLLTFMNENHLTLADSKNAGAGHGTFDLYADMERTQDPKATADNFISWCLENNTLPLFYEFADNPYYFKHLPDFSVLNLAEMSPTQWAAGAYENGEGLVYAPQQAVSMKALMTKEGHDLFIDKAMGMLERENAEREHLFGSEEQPSDTKIKTLERIMNDPELHNRPITRDASGRIRIDNVQYAKRSFAQQINELRDGTFPRSDHLYVMDTPKALEKAGFDQLPMLMTQLHAKTIMKSTGELVDSNYHGLTKNGIIALPNEIENTPMIIKSPEYDNRAIVFTTMKDKAGRTVIVPVQIGGHGRVENKTVTANIITTAYGKDDINDIKRWIVNAIMNNEVLYVNKERSFEIEKSVGVQFPKKLFEEASWKSIKDFANKVNKNGTEQNDVSDTLDSEGASYSDQSNAEEQRSVRVTNSVRDTNYKRAVDSGNMETAQRMVDERAEETMGDSMIRDEDGNLLKVYHGTDADFTVFDMNKGRSNMDIQGAFFSPWDIDAEGYGPNVRAFYLDIKNPAPENVAYRALHSHIGQNGAGRMAREDLIRMGYDGVNNGNEEFIAFYPEQIKSADAVTYDDNGNVIPLSERFNESNPDIRFSVRQDTAIDTREYLNNLDPNDIENVKNKELLQKYQKMYSALQEAEKQRQELQNKLNAADGIAAMNVIRSHLNNAEKKVQSLREALNKFERESAFSATVRQAEDFAKSVVAKGSERAMHELGEQQRKALEAALGKKYAQKLRFAEERMQERIATERYNRDMRDANLKIMKDIQAKVRKIKNLRLRETDYKNIREEYKPLADALVNLFTTSDAQGGSIIWSKEVAAQLAEKYELLGRSELTDDAYSDDVMEALRNAQTAIENYTDARKTEGYSQKDRLIYRNNALSQINEAVQYVYDMIMAQNNVFLSDKSETTANASQVVIDDANAQEDYREFIGKVGKAISGMDRMIRRGNMTPEYFFRNLANAGLTNVQNGFHFGENRYGIELKAAKDYIAQLREKYGFKEWGDKHFKFRTAQGRDIDLTIEQCLSLYATWKRENQKGLIISKHLENGGFVLDESEVKNKGLFGRQSMMTSGNRISKSDMNAIQDFLTPEQKAYADDIVHYLSTEIGSKGNRASMQLFGIKKYNEGYYFPIRSYAGNMYQRSDAGTVSTSNDSRIKHASFTNSRLNNAQNAVLLEDFDTVISNHINQMLVYSNMVVPIESFNRILNYKFATEDGSEQTVRSLITQKYGKNATEYIQQYLKDLNGGPSQDPRGGFIDKLLSVFKKSAVAGSLSVSMQQPLSYIRAAMEINPKYLTKALATEYAGVYDEMTKYSGVAVIKDMGKFDIGYGRGAVEWLKGDDPNRSKARKIYDKASEIATILPEKMDQITWTRMWQAVKLEQADLHKDMKTDSAEFLSLCGERFNDVMRLTQVYDSVLVRSNNMRSKRYDQKVLTSFMAEPTLTANMLYDAYSRIKERGGKERVAKATLAFLISAIAQAAIKGFMSALRSPNENKNLEEQFMFRATQNFLSEANPIGLIPGASTMFDALSGSDIDDSAWSVIVQLRDAGDKFVKGLTSDAPIDWKWFEDTAGYVSQLFTDIPAKNLMRDIRAIFNGLTASGMANRPTSAAVMRFQTNEAIAGSDLFKLVNDFLVTAGWGGVDTRNAGYYQDIYEAQKEGNSSYADDLKEYMVLGKGVDPKSVQSGVKSAAKKDDSMNMDQKIKFMTNNGYYADTKTAYSELYSAEHEGASPYTALQQGIKSNKSNDIKSAIRDLKKYGYKDKDIISKITSDHKQAYLSATGSKISYKNALIVAYQACGLTYEQAEKKINSWKAK